MFMTPSIFRSYNSLIQETLQDLAEELKKNKPDRIDKI